MWNSKRLWAIFGSSAIILLLGVFQLSAHATPIGAISPSMGVLPPVPMVVPTNVSSIANSSIQQSPDYQHTPLARGIEFFSKPLNLLNTAKLAGQMILGLYGLSLICTGCGAGAKATKSTANVIWGALFIGIALTAPELVGWMLSNGPPLSDGVMLPRAGGCG
jgi:hypothetical protein